MKTKSKTMKMGRALTAALGAIAVLGASARGYAQVNEAPRHAAEVLFKAGLKAVDKGNYQEAYDDFTKGYAFYPRGSLALSIGLTDMHLGRPVEALHYFRLALVAPDSKNKDRDEARRKIDEVNAQTGHIRVVAPDGATIQVDGSPSGTAPLTDDVDVMPGKHVVEAQAGQSRASVEVSANPGVVVDAEVRWSNPKAADTPEAPPKAADQPPPPTTALPATPQPPRQERGASSAPGSSRIIVAGALGVAALGALGTAIYFGAHSSSESDTAASLRAQAGSSRCPAAGSQCSALEDAIHAQNRDATLQRVLYGVAGAAAIGAVAVWLLWRPAHGSASTSAWIAPWAAEGTAGIAAGAGF